MCILAISFQTSAIYRPSFYGGVGRTPPFRRVVSFFFLRFFSISLSLISLPWLRYISLQAVRVLCSVRFLAEVLERHRLPRSDTLAIESPFSFLRGSLLISATRTRKFFRKADLVYICTEKESILSYGIIVDLIVDFLTIRLISK